MRESNLKFAGIFFGSSMFLFFLILDSASQPPVSIPGGRRLGQVEHFDRGSPPPSSPPSMPPGPPSQFDYLRPGIGPDFEVPAKEVLEQIFIARVASQLKFSDEQTVIFLKRFIEFQEKNKELLQQRKKLADSLRNTLRKKGDEVNRGELENFYNELLEVDKKIFDMKREFVDEISNGLEIEKKIQLYLTLSDFEEEVRKFLRKAYEWKQRRGKSDKLSSESAPSSGEESSE